MNQMHTDDRNLQAAGILAAMPADARARIASLETLDTIDSTNSELLRRTTPQHGCAILFADAQSDGRGRHGRAWASPPGSNLYVSFARLFQGDFSRIGGLSLAVGVAATDAMHAIGADGIGLKWPNDLVLRRRNDPDAPLRKLGGVLVECGMQAGTVRTVIGVGLNVRMSVDAAAGIDQPWIDLHTILGDRMPARALIAAGLAAAIVAALDRFEAEGLRPFRGRYAALDALYGREINAGVAGAVRSGIANGIDADGALRLRTAQGEVVLQAGEVGVRSNDRAEIAHATPLTSR
ncbi:MAG: biotin--[acetyl-CoA-carboxylase] ligase [Lysobacteraceae bacterium]|nr:MAG: biotin--[acetyl-CoA-carboxylase] ligase [Xanthomonadaceae bacterium]